MSACISIEEWLVPQTAGSAAVSSFGVAGSDLADQA